MKLSTQIKTLVKVIVFLCLAAIVFLFANKIVQPVWMEWNNYNTTYGFYEEQDNTIETVFLGSSDMIDGITPMELYENYGICAYNLSTEQQPMLASYYWMKEAYRLHRDTLDTVVLDVSMLRTTPSKSMYHKALDNMHFSSVKYNALKDYTESFAEFISWMIPVFSYHDLWENFSSDDFLKLNYSPETYMRGYNFDSTQQVKSVDSYTEIPTPIFYNNDTTEQSEFIENSLNYLKKMNEFCEEHDIQLVLIKTPHLSGENAWSISDHNGVQSLADEYQLDFLDFNFEPYIDEINYNCAVDSVDGAFQSYYGVTKLTHYLGNYLIEKCGNKDRRESFPFLDDELNEYERKIIKTELEKMEDPVDYLSYLIDQNDYMIFLSVRDEASKSLTEQQREDFASMGLKELSELEYRDSYLAVIDDGELVEEQRQGEEEFKEATDEQESFLFAEGKLDGKSSYALKSRGGTSGDQISSCIINDIEYSLNKRGINIIVYDKKLQEVVDAAVFDTWESSTRKSPNVELALATDLQHGLSYDSMSESEQNLYLYDLLCNATKAEQLTNEDGFLEYLDYFWNNDSYTIFISVKDEATKSLSEEGKEYLVSMGLSLIPDIESRDSYIAIASGGEVLEEVKDHSEDAILIEGDGYIVTSGGYDSGNVASIKINGTEYAQNTRGFNVVVYCNLNDTVMSSKTFDTYEVTPVIPEDNANQEND